VIVIMSNYKCGRCEYTSTKKYNVDKHIASHNNQDSQISEVETHNQKSQIGKTQNELLEMQNEISKKNEMIIQLTDQLTQLNIQLAAQIAIQTNIQLTNQIVTNQNIKISSQNVSTKRKNIKKSSENIITPRKYIMNTYREAPELKQLLDYSVILNGEDMMSFMQHLIGENEGKRLYIFIGDLLIEHYKKNDPMQQSIWIDNLCELTFIISNCIINNKTEWYIDKRGIRTTEYIIKPLIEYIETQVNEFRCDFLRIKKRVPMDLGQILGVLIDIRAKDMNRQILKYIAPQFDSLKLRNQHLQNT
jgi:hypothetical protein